MEKCPDPEGGGGGGGRGTSLRIHKIAQVLFVLPAAPIAYNASIISTAFFLCFHSQVDEVEYCNFDWFIE